MSTSTIKWLSTICRVEQSNFEEQLQNGFILCQLISKCTEDIEMGENALNFGNNSKMVDKNFKELRRLMRKLGLVLNRKEEIEIRRRERGTGIRVVSQIKRKLEVQGKIKEKKTFGAELENKFGFKNSNLIVEKKLKKFYQREEEKRQRHYAMLEVENKNRQKIQKRRIACKQKSRQEQKEFRKAKERLTIINHTNSKMLLGKKLGELKQKELEMSNLKLKKKENRRRDLKEQTAKDLNLFNQKVKRGEIEVKGFKNDPRQYKERKEQDRRKENQKVMQRIKGKYMGLDKKRQLRIEMQRYGKEEEADSVVFGGSAAMYNNENTNNFDRLPALNLTKKKFKQKSEELNDEGLAKTAELRIEEIEKDAEELLTKKNRPELPKFVSDSSWNNCSIRNLKKEVLQKRQKKFEFRYEIMEGIVWKFIEMSELVDRHMEQQRREKEKEDLQKEDSLDKREERDKQRVENYLRTLGREEGIQTISERTEESGWELEKKEELEIDWSSNQEVWREAFLANTEKLVPDKLVFFKALEDRGQIGGKMKRKNFMALPNLNDILQSLNRFSLKHHTVAKSFNIRKTNKKSSSQKRNHPIGGKSSSDPGLSKVRCGRRTSRSGSRSSRT